MAHPHLALRPNRNVRVSHYVVAGSKNPLPLGMGSVNSGKLMGSYGICWNDDLDIEAETIYEDGETIREERPAAFTMVGNAVAAARARKGLSQKELSQITGIDQSDLSRIERGIANPSVNTLNRIAEALDAELTVSLN